MKIGTGIYLLILVRFQGMVCVDIGCFCKKLFNTIIDFEAVFLKMTVFFAAAKIKRAGFWYHHRIDIDARLFGERINAPRIRNTSVFKIFESGKYLKRTYILTFSDYGDKSENAFIDLLPGGLFRHRRLFSH